LQANGCTKRGFPALATSQVALALQQAAAAG
jgi:hypothetical protein